jgi:biotin carboxylase
MADEHVQVSTLDMEGVLSLARARKASLVIATCVDRTNVTAAFVAEQLGLPAPYGYATAEKIANKLTMKQRLAELGVPIPRFQPVRTLEEAERLAVDFPIVVKPIDCGGSKGVRKASDGHELRLAVQEAFKVTRAKEILIEEFCAGVEVSADCFVADGEPHVFLLRQKYVPSAGIAMVLSNYACVCPAPISLAARDKIYRAARNIARGFGLRTTPLLIQFFVDGDDVRVVEFAPRVGGGMNYRLVPLHTGIDIVDLSVAAYFGHKSVLAENEPSGFISDSHVYADPGRFGEVQNQDRLLTEGVVDEFYVHKARGAEIGPSLSSADRVASFIVRAASVEELLRKTRKVFEELIVLDVHGRSIIRRDIHLKAL